MNAIEIGAWWTSKLCGLARIKLWHHTQGEKDKNWYLNAKVSIQKIYPTDQRCSINDCIKLFILGLSKKHEQH